MIEKTAPAQVRVGASFDYHIKVTNIAKVALEDVKVWDTVMTGFDVAGVDPKPASTAGGKMAWNIGKLGPNESRTIKITGSATGPGRLSACAEVTYRLPKVCASIEVVQPALVLTKTAPAKVMLCDPIPVKLVVKNTGDGPAHGVIVSDTLPSGLRTMGNESKLEFNAGTLAAGQAKEFTAKLVADKVGTFVNKAVATEAGGLKADASSTTVVVKPNLTVTKTGPAVRYLGRSIQYSITVSNGTGAEARNTMVTDILPAGAKLVKASDGGKASGGKVVWSLGTLAEGASKKLSVVLNADKPVVLTNKVSVTAYCADAKAEATTTVKGIPAILLEVIDLDDPIEIGAAETYQIIVTNQGSAMDTNIVIKCTLPAQQDYVRSKGPTTATADGQVVTFAPLKSLAPKEKAIYLVEVKGNAEGDVRFKTELTSSQLTKPVTETEATRIYK
jgi:uncharacterized repeat protein (TIGR01451 family)